MRGRATKPIKATPQEIREIYARMQQGRREARVSFLALLAVVVIVTLGGVVLRRADMAGLRLQIQERSRDRITSEEVHRLFEMHSRYPHGPRDEDRDD